MTIRRGPLMILAGAVLFGTTGASQSFAPKGIDPTATGALRMMISAPVLVLLTCVLRPRFHWRRVSPAAMLLGAGGVFTFQFLFFPSVHLTGVAVGTLVAVGCSPIAAGALGYFFLKEPLNWKWFLATGMTLAGCCFLILPGGDVSISLLGIGLAVTAGTGYGIFLLASKRLMDSGGSSLVIMAVILTMAAIAMIPKLLNIEWQIWMTPRGITVGLWLGVIATAFSYWLVGMGLAVTPISSAGLLSLAEPMTAAVLGIIVLNEPLTLLSAVGMVMIFAGMLAGALQKNAA